MSKEVLTYFLVTSQCMGRFFTFWGQYPFLFSPGTILSCSLMSNVPFLSNSIFTIVRKRLYCCNYSQYYGSQNLFVWKQHRPSCLCSSLTLLAEYWLHHYSWDCIIPHAFSVRQNGFRCLT